MKKYSLHIVFLFSVVMLMACGGNRSNRTYTDDLYSGKGGIHHGAKNDTTPKMSSIFKEYDYVSHADSYNVKVNYRVALILPFNIDSLYNDSTLIGSRPIPKAIYPALDFYEGALIAIDSLRKTGLNMELQVIDFSEKNSRFETVAEKYNLSKMDLLIGTLSSADAKPVAEFALKNKINFVSPLANNYLPEHNPFYLALNPSTALQQAKLVSLVKKSYGSSVRILIVHQNVATENTTASVYNNLLKKESAAFTITDFICTSKITTDTLKRVLSKTRKNVVLITSNEILFINSVIKKINLLADSTDITVMGMPSWNNFESLKSSVGKNTEAIFTNTYLVDKSTSSFTKFNREFVETYKIRPGELAVRGYNTMLLCGVMLKKNGPRFNYFMPTCYKSVYGNILIKPMWSTQTEKNKHFIQYYHNDAVNVMKVSAGNLTRVNME